MAIGFPPHPVYPWAIDSDRTLFLVYNTTEARLTKDNNAWAQELEITPVAFNEPEIWPNNGFATIEGEMFYYDSVEKNADNKVFKLKRCARNLGGDQTQFNPARTWVRGFVIAEHHNQMVDAIALTQEYVLEERDVLALLENEPDIPDDHQCPIVVFDVVVTDNSLRGVTISYQVTITGSFNQYALDFGDGTTTTDISGVHTYAPNTNPDPVVTVGNNDCAVVVTPTERASGEAPATAPETPILEIPICDTPEIPKISCIDCNISTDFTTPQIVFPCLDIPSINFSGFGISIPSININIPSIVISIPGIPSIINIVPPIPTDITIHGEIPSIIELIPQIPSIIMIEPTIPSVIRIEPSVISVNVSTTVSVIVLFDNVPTISVDWNLDEYGGKAPQPVVDWNLDEYGEAPRPLIDWNLADKPDISVSWGPTPTVSCVITVVCPTSSPPAMRMNEEFEDGFDNVMPEITSEDIGIPSEIKIIAPISLPHVQIMHNLPTEIKLTLPEIPELKIANYGPIRIQGPDRPLPDEIKITSDVSLPNIIQVMADNLPKSIKLDASDIPQAIRLEVPDKFPSTIIIDASGIPATIQVTGIPSSIELIHNLPTQIPLTVPENLEVPLVYRGSPIPIQLTMDNITGENGENCFALVPCGRK